MTRSETLAVRTNDVTHATGLFPIEKRKHATINEAITYYEDSISRGLKNTIDIDADLSQCIEVLDALDPKGWILE